MGKYIFNTSNLEEGGQYKNFKELFIAATGRTPPTGKTLNSVKATLSKHLEYVLEKDLNPDVSSRQAVVIMKIYNPPLTTIENRGKGGKYSDYLKPLILSQGSYKGKTCGLYNNLNLFKDYLLYVTSSNEKAKQNFAWLSIDGYDLWSGSDKLYAGEREYRRSIKNVMRGACERALDSLQKDGFLTWKYYHRIIPSVLVDIEERVEPRFKSLPEIKRQNIKREKFINEVMSDENCLMESDLLETLNIHSPKWDSEGISCDDYKRLVAEDKYSATPIRATALQEKAIKNYELFLRQHTYKEFYKGNHYKKIEDLPNEIDFFGNFGLSSLYNTLNKEYALLLLNCNSTWKELEFSVIDKKANLLQAEVRDTYSKSVTLLFIEYMENQMSKHKFRLDKKSVGDCPMLLGEKTVGFQYPLDDSLSAKKLHEKIKDCYELE